MAAARTERALNLEGGSINPTAVATPIGSGSLPWIPTGQLAYANGQLAAPGDAQTTTTMLSWLDPNTGGAVELFVDGNAGTIKYVLASTWSGGKIVTVHGYDTVDGSNATWIFLVTMQDGQVVATQIATNAFGTAVASVAISFGGSNELDILCTGDASTNPIKWVAQVSGPETLF